MHRSDKKFLFVGLFIAMCAGAVVCSLSGSGRPLRESNGGIPSEGADSQQTANSPVGGIQPRESDAANNMPLEWPIAENVDPRFLGAANNAEDLQARFEGGAAELLPTMVAVNSPRLLSRERKKCAEAFGSEISAKCIYTITNVLENSGGSDGTVVFSRAVIHDGSAETCEQFVGCVAKARVGTKIPIPPSSEKLTAFSQHIISQPAPPHLNDPVALKKLLDIFEEDVRAAREQGIPVDDYKVNYSVLKQAEIVEYMKQKLEELEQ